MLSQSSPPSPCENGFQSLSPIEQSSICRIVAPGHGAGDSNVSGVEALGINKLLDVQILSAA